MSHIRSSTRSRQGRLAAGALCFLLLAAAASRAQAQTIPSGTFGFSRTAYIGTENETFQAGIVNPVFLPTLNDRSVGGVVITVVRDLGSAGRVSVPFNTIDIPGVCGDTNSNQAVPFDGFCGDYLPAAGTLVFDDFEMSKTIVIPVQGDGVLSGNKTFSITLGVPVLDPLESLELEEPLISPAAGTADITIIEINRGNLAARPQVFGTNFVIERANYSVDEDDGTIEVDVLHPSGSGGVVGWELIGSDSGYPLSAGSDFAHFTAATYPNPVYTDGTTDFPTTRDFVVASGLLTFAPGQGRRAVNIQILDDDVVEFNEDLRIRLIAQGGQNPGLGFNSVANIKILYQENPAGSLDREWNRDNVSTTTPRFNPAPGANNPVRAVAVQLDNRTVIGGDFTAYNSAPRNRIARVNTDGSVDTTFEPGTGADDFVSGIAIYPPFSSSAGKLLVVGGFTSYNNLQRNGIARVNTDGSLDTTFSVGTGANGVVRAVAIQSDEKVVVVGEFTEINGIVRYGVARLNTDGSVDTSLDPAAGADGPVLAVAVASGRIYVAGEFMTFAGEFRSRVARLTATGAVDLTFEPGGGADGSIQAIALQPDGKLLIGGSFVSFDFRARSGLARLATDGSLDVDYDPGAGANDTVYAITLQPDGKALVGGLFTEFNHTRRVGLTRLFTNGKVDTSFLDTAYNQFAGIINNLFSEPRNSVNSIGLQSDGNVMIGGQFTQVGGNKSVELAGPPQEEFIPVFGPGGEYLRTENPVWSRAEKRARANLARLVGGYTPGPGNVEFVYGQNTVDENSPSLTVPMQRVDGQLGAIILSLGTTNGIAQGGGIDYEDTDGTMQWFFGAFRGLGAPLLHGEIGERYDFEIPIVEDSSIEGDETFELGVTAPFSGLYLGGELILTGGALGRSASSVTIVDNDFNRGEFEFSTAVYTTNENASAARVTVLRRNGSVGPVAVHYQTVDESALAGIDYTSTRGTLTFASGVTSQSFNVPLRDDLVLEPDKTFIVVITNATGGATIPPGASTSTAEARVRIIDNDIPTGRVGLYSVSPPTASFSTNEGAGFALILVERLGGSVGELSVRFTATNGTAIAGVDFTGVTNTLTWVHGDSTAKIVRIPILDNQNVSGSPRTVTLRLSSPSVAGTLGVAFGTLTITEDDSVGRLSFSRAVFEADERGTNVWITVVREGGSGGSITANYSAANGTAVNNTHFILPAGSLTLGPGVLTTNFVVTLRDNTNNTGPLTATLQLSGPGATGTYTEAELRILDDEELGDPPGSLDASFNALAGGNDAVNTLVLQPDGRILVGGAFRMMNRVSRTRVARLLNDGSLDETFDVRQGPNAPVRAMALQGDRVVIGGEFTQVAGTNRAYIARLLSDGTLDRFFNPGGGADAPVLALAALPDGGVVLGGGFVAVNGISRPGVAILNSNGTVRTSFNPGIGVAGTVLAVAVQPDGKIVIGGTFSAVNGAAAPNIARLLANGAVDTSFDVGQGPNGAVRAIALQPDGAMVIGGSFTRVAGVVRGRFARLQASGSLDTLFQNAVSGANSDVLGLALQYDGKVIAVGEFTRFNDVTRPRIARLNQNGKTDTTINFGQGANQGISVAVIQDDRRIVIGGRFTSFDGEERAYIARIHGGSMSGSGTFQFDAPFYLVDEFEPYAMVRVFRRGGLFGDVTIGYSTTDGSAVAGSDYTNAVGTLTFPEGETELPVYIPLINDSLSEDPETVNLSLGTPSAGGLGVVPNATLIIINDDSGLGFANSSILVNEGVAGGRVLVTVLRTGATNEVTTVQYSIRPDGTATPGEDYTSSSGTLTFRPGESSLTFGVAINDDDLNEATETFTIDLSNVTGNSGLRTATTVVSIVDNDFAAGRFVFASASYQVTENATNVLLTVLRTNGNTGVASVQYSTTSGTAAGEEDFGSTTNVLAFADGETSKTVAIQILEDLLIESPETFVVSLSNPTGGTSLGTLTNTIVTIVDNDVSQIVAAGSTLVSESLTNNSRIDPGERVTVSLALRNEGSGNTANLVGTLLAGNGVSAPSGSQNYGVLVAGGFAVSRNYTFTANGNSGDRVVATLVLTDGATTIGSATFAFTLSGQATRTSTSSEPITINDNAPANPYPSTIYVDNLGGQITAISVTISNFTHTFPDDVDILLVSPSGEKVTLMSDAGGNQPASNLTLTFANTATNQLPDAGPLASRTYQPTNYAGLGTADLFPAPAPGIPYTNTDLGTFVGLDPNGVWSLYVIDDNAEDAGRIGGWSIRIQTSDPVTSSANLSLAAFAPSPIAVGSEFPCSFTVTNRGPATAREVVFVDEMPAGLSVVRAASSTGSLSVVGRTLTWNVGSIPNGGSAVVTMIARATAVGTMVNRVTVGSDQVDLNPADNSATILTSVAATPALFVTRSGGSVRVSWPIVNGFELQSTPSLGAPIWTKVTNVPQQLSGNNVLTLPADGTARYYRLVAP